MSLPGPLLVSPELCRGHLGSAGLSCATPGHSWAVLACSCPFISSPGPTWPLLATAGITWAALNLNSAGLSSAQIDSRGLC
eukprot:2636656-Karenia_brevis.AAC.1